MSHDHHESLPGYDPRQIFVDGCKECEHRGDQPFDIQVSWLDPERFVRASVRAGKWSKLGVDLNVSAAEAPLLRGLQAVLAQVQSTVVRSLSIEDIEQMMGAEAGGSP